MALLLAKKSKDKKSKDTFDILGYVGPQYVADRSNIAVLVREQVPNGRGGGAGSATASGATSPPAGATPAGDAATPFGEPFTAPGEVAPSLSPPASMVSPGPAESKGDDA